jgi:hypothetical protein
MLLKKFSLAARHWHEACTIPGKEHKHPPVADPSTTQASNRRVTTPRARPPLNRRFSKVLDKAKTKSRLSYAYLALGDYRFPPVPVKHERAADGKFNIVTRDGADTSVGRSGWPGFAARAA